MAAFLILSAPPSQAQSGTEIYVAPLSHMGEKWTLGPPVNVTNRPGYDNQPSFTLDGSAILFTSIRDKQADIYRVDLVSGNVTQVTDTPESEYSPRVIPDGTGIATVRVERDSTQRLCRFTMNGKNPQVLFPDVEPVGYYAWGDDGSVAFFVLGEPPTLRMAHVRFGKAAIITYDVGRSMHQVPGKDMMSFTEKISTGTWIRVIELMLRRTWSRVRVIGESQDYAWMPDGETILMANGSILYRAGQDGIWKPVADLASAGLRGITRLAVSPRGDRVALVAEEMAKEVAVEASKE